MLDTVDNEIIFVLHHISSIVRREGYLIGDFFHDEERTLNPDCVSVNLKRSPLGWIVEINACNRYLANCLEEKFEKFKVTQFIKLKIKGGMQEKTLALKPLPIVKKMNLKSILQKTRSTWLKNPGSSDIAMLTSKKATLSVYKLDPDSGYPCLEVVPKMGIEKVLSQPRSELLNKPASYVPSNLYTLPDHDRKRIQKVAEIKAKILEDLINGKDESAISYTVYWQDKDDPTMDFDTIWKHRYIGRVLGSTGEAILTAFNEEGWQERYWERMALL